MSANPPPFAELQELIDQSLEGRITASEMTRLEELLRASPNAAEFYHDYLSLHVELYWMHHRSAIPWSLPASGTARVGPPGASFRGAGRILCTLAAYRWMPVGTAVALFLAVGVVWWATRMKAPPSAPTVVARLSRCVSSEWASAGPRPTEGQSLPLAPMELRSGFAEITFSSGAVVLLEAPAKFEATGDLQGILYFGRAVVQVPPSAVGFAIDTRKAKLVDLGTEFGVDVSEAGGIMVQVFRGSVVADLKSPGSSPKTLSAKQGFRMDAIPGSAPLDLLYSPDRFVRTLPDRGEEAFGHLRPDNRRRYDCVHVVPAPAKLFIDGDLSDWDRSGQFISRMEPPYGKTYYVEGCMMYDEHFLYLGAHVGDPAPMCSIIDAESDPEVAWKGGSVQVRLSTSRDLGWPLEGRSATDEEAAKKGHGKRPQDVSENLVHITMWYYRPADRPSLILEYGMDFHRRVVNPAGFQGAFRRDADGKGYTLEYAIPWSLLSAGKQPPRAGDRLGACWQIHWSDAGGRIWRGHIVEIARETTTGFSYQRADDWGAAIYHPGGHLSPGTVRPRTSVLD